jgi:signal peptidase II
MAAENGALMRDWRLWLIPASVVLVLDQLTKWSITASFEHLESKPVTGFFNLVLAHNSGAAFSMLAEAGGWQRVLFSAIALVAAIVIIWLLAKHRNEKLFCAGLSLILAGAIGNLIDRVRFGYVVDFLDFHLEPATAACRWLTSLVGTCHWPAFNVADSSIFIGAVLLIWDSFRKKPAPAQLRRQQP